MRRGAGFYPRLVEVSSPSQVVKLVCIPPLLSLPLLTKHFLSLFCFKSFNWFSTRGYVVTFASSSKTNSENELERSQGEYAPVWSREGVMEREVNSATAINCLIRSKMTGNPAVPNRKASNYLIFSLQVSGDDTSWKHILVAIFISFQFESIWKTHHVTSSTTWRAVFSNFG